VTPLSGILKMKATRAIERRFGKSMMPYRFIEQHLGIWRCLAAETGLWIDFLPTPDHRPLRVVGEHNGARPKWRAMKP
jgi:hypothetical protein